MNTTNHKNAYWVRNDKPKAKYKYLRMCISYSSRQKYLQGVIIKLFVMSLSSSIKGNSHNLWVTS